MQADMYTLYIPRITNFLKRQSSSKSLEICLHCRDDSHVCQCLHTNRTCDL